MSAKRFLDLIEGAGLLDSTLMADLRRQLAEHKPTAAAIAKHLVDRGHLTKFQATKFVSDSIESPDQTVEHEPTEQVEDELTLAPIDDDPGEEARIHEAAALAAEARHKHRVEQGEDEGQVVRLEEAGDALMPVEDAGAGLTPVGDLAEASPLDPSDMGISDLMSDLDAGDPFEDPFAQPEVTLPKTPPPHRNVWESKLMFGGGLALALLVLLFVVLFVNLYKTPALEMWEAAMEDYRSGSYTQAEAGFESFLESYPDDDRASEGRVRSALCQIRIVLGDAGKGLERSQTLLPEIEDEASFSVARDELATVLIEIPTGFIQTARNVEDLGEKERLVALAEQGMELVNNPSYVPSSRRSAIQNQVKRVMEDIRLVHRQIEQDQHLAQAILDIDAAAEKRQTAEAYGYYQSLVKDYPGLEKDAELLQAVRRISVRQRELVTVQEASLNATTTEATSQTDQRVIFATSGEATGAEATVDRVPSQVVTVEAHGSFYGLDLRDGRVLWDRYIGNAIRSPPTPVSEAADADILLLDHQSHTLFRVDVRTGNLVWRVVIGEECFPPVVQSGTAWVTTHAGSVVEVDTETGHSRRRLVIPQSLSGRLALAPTHPLMFLAGLEANLYSISKTDLRCEDVFYVGHRRGAIAVPPFVHFGHVFLAENLGSDYSVLRVFAIETSDQGATLQEVQQPMRLVGQVSAPMRLHGRRLLVVTDRLAVEILDVDINRSPPVSRAASLKASNVSPALCFLLSSGNALWIGSDRLSRFRVQVTTKTVQTEQVIHSGDVFLSTPQLFGDVIVHTRRPKKSASVVATAVSVNRPRVPLWETRLGARASEISVAADTIRVITSDACLFEVTREELQQGYDFHPTKKVRSPSQSYGFTRRVMLSDKKSVIFNALNDRELLVHSPEDPNPDRRLRLVTIRLPEGAVTSLPLPLMDGLLFSLDTGEIVLRHVDRSGKTVRPFRPRISPGEKIQWRRPCAIDERTFVVTDDRRRIYRVEVRDAPEPHFAASAEQTLESAVQSGLAFADDSVFAIVRGGTADQLAVFDPATLDLVRKHDLDGRATWGPTSVNGVVLVVADNERVQCFDGGEQPRWEQPAVAYGQPSGLPLISEHEYVFASHGGDLWRISQDTGEEIGRSKVEMPLISGPVRYGEKILLASHDGAIHVVPVPAATSGD